MEFLSLHELLTSHELHLSLIIETLLLLLLAIGIIFRLKRRISGLSCIVAASADPGQSLSEYLRSEVKKSQEKQDQLGQHNPESVQLRAACRLRAQVLTGEIYVLESAREDETHYWQPVRDYYDVIRNDFSGKVKMLEGHLEVSQQRIKNLERFKDKVFQLRDTLDNAYENNSRLEKELREKIQQGAKVSELEHTLSQMEVEKETLIKELQLAEHEFVAIMKNASAGAVKDKDITCVDDMSDIIEANTRVKELESKLKRFEEENSFLCDQIQALLSEEMALEGKEEAKDKEFLELEKKYAKMEDRYLKLQDKLDKDQQSASKQMDRAS